MEPTIKYVYNNLFKNVEMWVEFQEVAWKKTKIDL